MSELPKGWINSCLKESLTTESFISDGDWVESKDQDMNGSVRLLQLADIGDGVFKNKSSRFMNIDTAKKLNCTFLEQGDLLIARMPDPLGRACIFPGVNQKAVTVVDVCLIRNRGDSAFINSLLKYWINSPLIRNLIDSNSSGSTRKRITRKKLEAFSLPLPPLAEQKRIVEKLDQVLAQVDTIKARLDGIPAILKRFRQSVLAAAVSGKLTEEWRGNTPFTAIKNIGSLITDIRYGTSKKCSEISGNTPVLRIPNIGDGKVSLDNLKYADFDEKELTNLALKEGDLLLIRSNGSVDLVGKLAVITIQSIHCLFAGYLIRLRLDRDLVNPRFVAFCLQSPSLRQIIELKAKSTSGVNNINTKEISSLEIPVPSLDEQTEIVRLVDQYFAFADAIEQQVKKAQQRVDKLTQSILAKAFKGELVPQEHTLDKNYEPADQLLKRIAAARAESEALAKAAKQAAKKTTKKAEKKG